MKEKFLAMKFYFFMLLQFFRLNRNIKVYCMFAVFSVFSPVVVTAGEFSGYFKNFSLVLKQPEGFGEEESLWMVSNRIRLQSINWLTNTLRFEGAYDFSPRIQHRAFFSTDSSLFSSTGTETYRMSDPDTLLTPSEPGNDDRLGVYQNIDRLFLSWSGESTDIIIGRQAIAWGTSRAVSPTDILAPFAFNALDTEERPGVDALRIRIATGLMGELDMGWVFGYHFRSENNAFYIRKKTVVADTDVSLILMSFRKHTMAGVNVARSIGEAGFWFEGAWTDFENTQYAGDDSMVRLTTGLDYRFPGDIYAFAEYHYNGGGVSSSNSYLMNSTRSELQDSGVYLMGKHYLNTGFSVQLTPLNILSGTAMISLTDGSVFISSTWEYNMRENMYLSAGIQTGTGDTPSLVVPDSPLTLTLNSEFGSYPEMVYVSLRYYF